MLYTVSKPPSSTAALESVLRIAPAGAPILLYEDGVYATVPGARCEPALSACLRDHPVYALDADLEARGISAVLEGVQIIGYDGFVELVEQHDVAPWI